MRAAPVKQSQKNEILARVVQENHHKNINTTANRIGMGMQANVMKLAKFLNP